VIFFRRVMTIELELRFLGLIQNDGLAAPPAVLTPANY